MSIPRLLCLLVALSPLAGQTQTPESSPLKFAFYSPSWASDSVTNLRSGLRLVIDNQTGRRVRLDSIEFLPSNDEVGAVSLNLGIEIPAGSLGERELPYLDLLAVNDCVSETLSENWRLVEISNYTLNPSVRRLIIEDTSAFRIYQCVSTVRTRWTELDSNAVRSMDEWVLYHFERRSD